MDHQNFAGYLRTSSRRLASTVHQHGDEPEAQQHDRRRLWDDLKLHERESPGAPGLATAVQDTEVNPRRGKGGGSAGGN